jgi:hypothetical protein
MVLQAKELIMTATSGEQCLALFASLQCYCKHLLDLFADVGRYNVIARTDMQNVKNDIQAVRAGDDHVWGNPLFLKIGGILI